MKDNSMQDMGLIYCVHHLALHNTLPASILDIRDKWDRDNNNKRLE